MENHTDYRFIKYELRSKY